MFRSYISYSALPHTPKSHYPVPLEKSNITTNTLRRNIGVIFDNCNLLREHITSVCHASHFYLRNIGSIGRYLTPETCDTLVHKIISFKLNNFNSQQLRSIAFSASKNNAARIVRRLPHLKHITADLHWLPIQQRIEFKVVLFIW